MGNNIVDKMKGENKMDNKGYKYRVSVIIPIYNSEAYLEKCIDSCMVDQGDYKDYQVVLVNDGSSDSSPEICDRYAAKYPNIKVIHKENEKLSATRNRGMRESDAKYFLYLDSDDTLLPHTIDKVADFFDKHYDEIDLVTYPQIDILRDGTLRKHFRFDIMKKSGVYDLKIHPYICQTRVNVMAKNKGEENNVYFDTTPNFRHEDSCYNAYVLKDKMKIGFCDEGGYVYALNNDNITANYFYAYYIFETSMNYYEELFASFENGVVPKYFQSLVLNDLSWKLRSNKILPYHYTPEELEKAKERVRKLVEYMDEEMILSHPDVDLYHKHFFLSLKKDNNCRMVADDDSIVYQSESKSIARWRYMGINLQKITMKNNKLRIYAAAKSSVSIHMKQRVWVQENDDPATMRELDTTLSTYSYNRAKMITGDFRRFVYECDMDKVNKIQFFVEVSGHKYPAKFSHTVNVPFDNTYECHLLIRDGYVLKEEELFLTCSKPNKKDYEAAIAENERVHQLWYDSLDKEYKQKGNWLKERDSINRDLSTHNVWLYNDANTNIENGLMQFRYDMAQNDGIERYYVYDNELSAIKHHFKKSEMPYLVRFGSKKHRSLFHRAAKILTAYAQLNYYCPFERGESKFYKDLWNYEVVYLQHGILHATLPWQYGNDRLALDKVVVSSEFEKNNMIDKYCFCEDEIIDAGMVRLDFVDREAKPKNRILIAPSWRHYLIGDIRNNRWTPQTEKFLKSDYFVKYMEFFNSEELKKFLEDNDMYLDFKLHPIFELYKEHFVFESDRIQLAESAVELSDYKICITDFSSFVFDFVYCNKPVLYFMPDYDQFRSGMHTYRELDLPLEDGFGKFTADPAELVANIKEIAENDYQVVDAYKAKTEHFFTYYDNHAKRTYEALIAKN